MEQKSGHDKNRPREARPIFVKIQRFPDRSLAILLDPGGAEAGKAVLINGKLPGKEFVDGQGVAAAGFLQGEKTAADRGYDFGLTANDPPFRPGCRKVGYR